MTVSGCIRVPGSGCAWPSADCPPCLLIVSPVCPQVQSCRSPGAPIASNQVHSNAGTQTDNCAFGCTPPIFFTPGARAGERRKRHHPARRGSSDHRPCTTPGGVSCGRPVLARICGGSDLKIASAAPLPVHPQLRWTCLPSGAGMPPTYPRCSRGVTGRGLSHARGCAASYTRFSRSVVTWVYTWVVTRWACPSSSCTLRRSAPASRR